MERVSGTEKSDPEIIAHYQYYNRFEHSQLQPLDAKKHRKGVFTGILSQMFFGEHYETSKILQPVATGGFVGFLFGLHKSKIRYGTRKFELARFWAAGYVNC
jgi:hypothetical protein